MADKTRCVFRRFIDGGDVIAVFPDIHNLPGQVMTYQHIGQHGGGDWPGLADITHPARPHEYEPLKKELESIGYDLHIVQRVTR